MTYPSDTLCGVFHNQAIRYNTHHAFLSARFDREGRPSTQLVSLTWSEVREAVFVLAQGLIALGVNPGDRVAIFSESRPRWIIADQAIQACGAVGVPLYPTVTAEELAYMLEDSGARVVFVSTPDMAAMVRTLPGEEGRSIISMSPWDGAQPADVYTFEDLRKKGQAGVSRETVEDRIRMIAPQDVCSIIYTSGTTGKPKGVILTQENWVANMQQCASSEIMQRTRALDLHLRCLVHLPLCHVYARTSDYHVTGLYLGGELIFSKSYYTVPKDLRELRPQVLTSIPRLYEKAYDTIHSTMKRTSKIQRVLFGWALKAGQFYVKSLATGKRMPPHELIQFALANVLVFERLKKMTGMDCLVLAISGGGKLSREVCSFFRAMGIQLNEGYGLTETSPVVNFNAPEIFMEKPSGGLKRKLYDWIMDMTVDLMVVKPSQASSPYLNPVSALKLMLCYYTLIFRLRVKPGMVGRAVKGTEELIAEDGEILVKGPQIFRSYWNRPEETLEAFTPDGFFKTGDIGRLDREGFLEITDRKKELFVTSGGKNVAPHPIELTLTARPYIDQACIVGDGRKYLTALIVPDFQELARVAKQKSISFATHAELLRQPEITALIQRDVDQVNAALARYEQIKYYELLDTPFVVETGELTPTLKIKRRIVAEKYKAQIERMYQQSLLTA